VVLVSCSGSSTTMIRRRREHQVNADRPAELRVSDGSFDHVYVIIRSCRRTPANGGRQHGRMAGACAAAQFIAAADDLFAAASNTCLLTNLARIRRCSGTTADPSLLVPNDGSGGATPSTNACGSQDLIAWCSRRWHERTAALESGKHGNARFRQDKSWRTDCSESWPRCRPEY